jgi:hypothetical protein
MQKSEQNIRHVGSLQSVEAFTAGFWNLQFPTLPATPPASNGALPDL